MPPFIQKISTAFHQQCLDRIPPSTYSQINSAILCGAPLHDFDLKKVFLQTGLFHIIVVSGAHLLFFQRLLNFVLDRFLPSKMNPAKQFIILSFLIYYCLLCRMQAPIVRATIHFLLQNISKKLNLSLSQPAVLILSIVFSLALFPEWTNSLSIILSGVASLALVQSRIKEDDSPISQQIRIYLFLFPLFIGWGNNHPITILTNILITPLISFFILPCSLIVTIFHPLTTILDKIYSVLIQFLEFICQQTLLQTTDQNTEQFTQPHRPLPISIIWIYFFFLVLVVQFTSVQKRRDEICLKI